MVLRTKSRLHRKHFPTDRRHPRRTRARLFGQHLRPQPGQTAKIHAISIRAKVRSQKVRNSFDTGVIQMGGEKGRVKQTGLLKPRKWRVCAFTQEARREE